MADQSNILREYLISLGFKVDEVQGKRFDEGLTRWDKRATNLSKALIGVGVAAQVMVTEFAFRMEKMYYSSRLAESTANNLQALDFGGKNIGISNMAGQVERFAAALRANPGLTGLLHSLGVKVEGRDKSDVLMDLVEATKKMPFYIGQRYASMFGINPDDLLLMQEGLATMKAAADLRKSTAKELGVDADKAAESARELMNEWRSVIMVIGLAKDALIVEFLPAMREVAGVTKQVLGDWIKIVQTPREKFVEDLKLGLNISDEKRGKVELSEDAQRRLSGGKGFTPAEQKIYDDLPYHAPKGNTGMARAFEDYLFKRARKQAVLRGELPADPAIDRQPGTMTREEAGIMPNEKEELYKAPAETTGGPRKWFENWQRWRENRDRAKRGEPPLPEPTPTPPAPPAAPRAPAAAPQTNQNAPAPPAAPAPGAALPPERPASAGPVGPTPERQTLMQQLEIKYALPAGTLDKFWQQESKRSRNLFGPETKYGRAKGPFQLLDSTAKEYGVQDPHDFKQAAPAAAEKIAGLLKRYGGNMQLAAAAYNWGEGNLDRALLKAMEKHPTMGPEDLEKYVLGVAPKETRDYVNSVAPSGASNITIHQDNKYTITEARDAKNVAKEITETQKAQAADTVRQFTPRIQ